MFHSFRSIKVNLICQNHPSTEISTEGDDDHPLVYVFYLSSPAACPSKQSSSHHGGHKSIIGPIGIGIIFLYVGLFSINGFHVIFNFFGSLFFLYAVHYSASCCILLLVD